MAFAKMSCKLKENRSIYETELNRNIQFRSNSLFFAYANFNLIFKSASQLRSDIIMPLKSAILERNLGFG